LKPSSPGIITIDRTWDSRPCDHRYTHPQHRRTDCRISTETNADVYGDWNIPA
jgi:hypothetical protein